MKENFNLYDKDQVKIYISKNLATNGEDINIKFSSMFGIFKNLDVFGFEIN